MAAPVISASSSILGFRRGESFEFQPAATNVPVIWSAVGLPAGVTIDSHPQQAATGDETTDVITVMGHGFSNGDQVFFESITGGSGLTANTIYFVRDKTTDTFKLATTADGAAINFTTAISAGQVRKVGSGLISGSAGTAGVYVVMVSATNMADEVGTREFVIGISPEISAEGANTNLDAIILEITVPGNEVRLAGGSGAGADAAVFLLKEGDVRLLILRFVDAEGTRLDPDPDSIKFVLKEFEPDGVVITEADFEKTGSGATAEFLVPVDLSGAALAGALSNYEEDAGTGFDALAEIEWERGITFDSSPLTLRSSTPTFKVRLERDLADN